MIIFTFQATANLIKTLGWKKFVIVYENEESLVRLQEVAKLPKGFDSDLKVTFRQLNTDSTDYRPLLKQIKTDGDTRIVLDCSFEKIESVLMQALEVGIVTDYHGYVINSMVRKTEQIKLIIYKIIMQKVIHQNIQYYYIQPRMWKELIFQRQF